MTQLLEVQLLKNLEVLVKKLVKLMGLIKSIIKSQEIYLIVVHHMFQTI